MPTPRESRRCAARRVAGPCGICLRAARFAGVLCQVLQDRPAQWPGCRCKKRGQRERETVRGGGSQQGDSKHICSSMPSAKNPKQSRPLHNISGGTGGPRVCECQATLMPGRKKEKRDIERERKASGHSSQAKEIFMNSVFRTGIVH